jgi:hypothetical protein
MWKITKRFHITTHLLPRIGVVRRFPRQGGFFCMLPASMKSALSLPQARG